MHTILWFLSQVPHRVYCPPSHAFCFPPGGALASRAKRVRPTFVASHASIVGAQVLPSMSRATACSHLVKVALFPGASFLDLCSPLLVSPDFAYGLNAFREPKRSGTSAFLCSTDGAAA